MGKFKWRPIGTFAARAAAYLWAAPYTAVGLMLGSVALLLGATPRLEGGAVEFSGGYLGKILSRLPAPFAFVAITVGHVIIGVDPATLDRVRPHERVHVRQYERWGPLFVPAYLFSSLVQLARGRHPYLDNAFEREARAPGGTRNTRRRSPR